MPSLSLKIVLDEGAVTRKVKFNTNMTVKQALAVVKDKVIVPDKGKEYALFLRSADDDMTGVWLEDDRTLDYYMLRDGDSLDYICRIRTLRVKLLDDTVKTLQVDEAKTVGELMMSICARIGITNYDEYGLCHEEEEETEEAKEVKEGTGTLTLKRKQAKQERDAALEQLSKKLKTDDNVEWLDLHRSLREQGIDPKETLLLKRRLYYSDRNVDSRDPVQLHLLYVQTRDTILNGTHPVTEQQAVQFAGIQCQVQLGDYQEKKHKPGFIENFEEYLPAQYLNAWNIEKKIVKEFSQHQGLSELEAKFLYIKTARSLPTYGVTFFLVKEKQKDKKKLVPRLLGINSHAILRLDEVTKEILQEWPLTHVKTYHAGKSQTFTLNFGDYSDKEYSVKTQDCHRIRDILEGYIDIIRRRMLAKPSRDPGESMAICHDNIQQGTSHLIQHVSNNPSKIVTETFVGPNKLMTSEHGSQPQSGTMITTVQQLVVTDHLQNQQMALKGEMPLRSDMSKDCINKLNKMNSNSVKIVGLLTDPTEHDYEEIQKIVRAMKEDFPDIDKGVKETADKQAIEDAKRMLLDELHDLNNFMNKLDATTASGHFDREGAKDAAENIADLTTQVYFSLDPKTRRRSELIRRSRNKMKAGEKSEQSMRRASFLAAANSAQHALDSAVQTLNEDYTGPKPDAAQRMQLEKALEDKMGKLNAAIALYLTAHSDPENIDYASAINSMNAINELMPEIAKDTQVLASTLEPSSREQLLDDMQELCDATRAVCGTISAEDHAKMQEATNQYAGIAGKLISTFARGTNADKEHEIIELAKDVGAKTSLLLVSTNELTCQAASEPAAADVDTAGVRVAEAATDLIACAQLTAPAIHEPHCQSALTAACEGIGSSVHQLETAWRPLLEDQTRQPMNDQLHSRVVDVGKALERLKDAYANLGGGDDDDSSLPAQERKRLKFIATMNGAKGRLQGVEDLWNQQSATGVPSDAEKAEAQRRMEQSMAQLNAAIAALAAATADRENPDYETAELAIATISELMPQIVQDAETVSSDKDEATRNAMQKNIRALCDATRKICEGDGCKHVDGEEAANFAAASGKLLFLISPGADKGRQKFIMEESAIAQEHAAQLVAGAHRLQTQVPEHTAAELASRAARTADAANALGAVAQVTAPSISSPRCQDALSSAASQLLGSADSLTAVCQPQALEQPELQAQCAALTDTHQQLADSLHRLTDACNVGQGDTSMTEPSAQQEKKRLQFVKSTAAAKQRLDAAAQQLNKPLRCHMMEEGHAAALGQKLNDRIAQLNAAVAALAAATSDRENPDYEAAERAVNTISQIMPHLIQDSQMLCGTKSDAEQAAMLQELRALCEATQELCEHAGQAQGVGDAIAKYTDASTKLVYCATPRADNEMENEILGLTTDACGKASELLSQVQQLTERVADAGAAAELDRCGASAADAAQALLTVAQATASTMDSPCCKDQLISAAQKLRRCADELTSSCEPHTAQLPDARRQLGTSHRQLADSLDKLVQACQKIPEGSQSGVSQPPKEKQRLKFMNSLTGARNRLYDAEQQLKQPLPKHQLSPEQAAALEQRLSQRLAQLNAAVAALAAAKADPENPDWKTAEQSVKEISELMPLIVQDSRQLSSTKDGAGQAAMLDDLKALCHASRSLCENSETDPKISTKEFHKAASKLKFIVSPTADKSKEKQVVELAKAACKQAERLAVNAQTACPAQAPLASSLHEAAGTLDSVVQATSASPSDPRCCAAVNSSVDNVRHCAQQLTSSCEPPLMTRPEVWQQLLSCQRQLTNDLDKLVQAHQPEHGGTIGTGSGQQEQQRLKFINSASGAKGRLNATEQLLKEPLVCQLMKEEDGAALQRRLGARVAQLNAAVAALTAATADREHPDYVAADQAIQHIAQLMPQVVQESRTLCGTKSDAEQAAMLQELRALCEATQELCEHAGQAQGVSDAAAKFSAASGKLVYVVSPKTQDAHEKQVLALAATSCGKASELLSQVQQLTERVTDAGAAAELDRCGASAADAAQALLTVAQTTAPTISDPQCQKQVMSSAQKLRRCADELIATCEPHTAQLPDVRRQLGSSHRQLDDSLANLVQACVSVPHGAASSEQQEQQRLKFINSASGAKGRLNATEQLLKEPLVCQLMKEEDGAALQRRLGARVAQLNAAVAALTAATADREHPDYVAADQAIQHIAQLMPQVVQESRTLCGTKSDAEQAAMLQELRALCEATQELCEHAGQAQGVSDAAAKFSAASGKLVYVVSPKTQDAHEKQVLALAATSCGKASELLSQVQQLTERVTDAGAAAELDRCGASAADAAQALLTVAQTTAPTISDPQCQKQVMSSAQKLRRCADELIATCEPHTAQLPDVRRQLGSSHRQLDDSLANLVQACVSVPHGAASSEQQEQQRLKFINSASGAKGRLNATEQLLKEPLVCQLMKEEDGAALQRRLGARVAQLNAAVAALTAATADREHPDYVAADQAIQHIAQLMPQVVQESRTLCGTKSDAEQAAMLQELRALCEATQELCEHAGQAQGVSDAAAKFSAASGKLVYVVSPKTQDAHEKQVLALAATSCGKASELLSQVQQLTERVTDAGAAAELDRCGASAADAAQALLTVAQTTAPTISDPQCQKQVMSSAQKLRRCADELIATCEPHTAQLPDVRRQLGSSHRQLDESLDKLVQVCHSASGVVLSPQQEQQRLKFVSSISGTQSKLDTAEQQMKKPVVVQPLQQADSAALQQQLSRRLAQLNAAIAALAAATTDGKNPDYPAAERAVTTVIELMPEIVQDSYKICSTKEPTEQAAMMQELRELCETSRIICDSAGHPIKLNEATARLADASSKLLHIVSPDGKHPGGANRGPKPAVQPRKPAVPVRDPKHTVAKAVHSGQAPDAQSFLDAMRAEESGGHIEGHVKSSKTAEEEKLAHKQFSEMIENAERGLKSAEEGLQVLYKAKNVTVAGHTLPALEVVKREQHMEDTLAKAGIEVAALVSANYADKLDYKAAMQPTLSLTESVRSVVNDGSAICTSMSDEARKKFLEDMIGLCQSTKILCDTAKSEKEKLNDAAIVFGDQSVKLLRVVSCNVDPALEKEAISRAKAIGDAASRLALEATSLASSTSEANNPGTADSQVRDICAAGTSCVDSAGKLVYTAKLIAPTIHHETCQDALVSSADSLSSSLTTFTNTLAPLASTQHPNVQKLLGEAGHLEKLVEKLRKDVRAGKLGKRKEVDPVVDLDFPLRNLTQKIIDNAKNMVRDETMSSQTKKEYTSYCGKLEEALRALDLANARYQRAPHDINKRDEFEMTIDELQMTVLQSRPAKAGQEQNNIVDFRDFLQDLVNEAGDLQKTVRKNEGPIGKRTSEDITMLCSKISEDASKLLNPNDNFGQSVTVMNTVDDILDIDLFGQECDTLVKEINNSIQGVQDQKTKQELLAKSLPMLESCHLLRFAAKSHIMATQSSAYNEIMQNLDHFKSTTMSTLAEEAAKKSVKQTKPYASTLGSQCCLARASSRLVAAGQRAARGEPHDLVRAVTHYAVSSAAETPAMAMAQDYQAPKVMEQVEQVSEHFTLKEQVEEVPVELEEHVVKENMYKANLSRIVDWTDRITSACKMSMSIAAYEPNPKANKCVKELNELDYKLYPRKVSTQVLNSDDIDRLLLCPRETVEGTPKQLEEKLQQLSSKLSSMGSTVVLSVSAPSSLARSLHAAAQAAVQLANTARALADRKRPAQCKLIEDAAHEMCLSTYSLMKTSELVCQEPNHHDSKRKLLEACRHLNDSINKLVRSTGTGQKSSVGRACGEAGRSLALPRGTLQAAPRPPAASSYALSLHTMQSQRDVLQKLNSDEAMSREEFLKSMNYAVTAVNNSAECAAQAAYLISVSDQDKSIGLKGPVDVGKLQKAIQAVEDTCISIIITNDDIQVAEEKKTLKSQMKDLEDTMKDAVEKTKEGELKEMLKECTNDLLNSHHRLEEAIEYEFENKVVITSKVAELMHDVSNVASLVEHPDLVPVATEISADTQKHVDEIVKNSLTLLSNTEELVKQVKAAPEEPMTMKWVMFNKRKDVLDAFENLLRSVKSSGQRVNLLEAAVEEPEEDKKSYVETQFDLASKWLSKPMCKPEVKSKGQEAVRNLIDVANKVSEDLQGSDKEDMKNLIVETEQLLKECSQKYDQEQYSVLLERVRELKKGVSRGVVSKLVQDFMQAEEPLADLDLIAEYEQDESKRKFMLEKKIAELLAQLGRVTGTARLVAHTHAHRADDIHHCSQQTELLAPILVKAAQERIARPDDKAVIENYKSLLAKYAESMSKIRDLCDQSVDPMEFVQTAGETIERMREESSTQNDPLHNAHTSTAISKLADRVIHVGMSSSTARRDPELQRALAAAQHQLAAATPAPDTRASKMPDFKDTTARILQATEEVESLLCGETIFKQQPTQNQPIFNEAMNLHVAIRDWSSRDNEIVAVAKRMAVLMAKLSNFMNNDKQREVLATSKSIVLESHEVARLAKKLAHECTDHRIKTNLLQTCERIPTISGQLKMLTTVKGFSLGRHGTQEDKEAMDMLVGNAQSLMLSIQDVVKGAASASVKIMSQRGPRMKWVRKTVY